ncbi:hypothetical protein SAMN05421787_104187 [Virgibacillus pantothenticus]|nr:hypothetical protein SAMN05421787_104187 [Virgibacillus pantothenticus]
MNQTGSVTKIQAYLYIRYAIFSNNSNDGIRLFFYYSK